MCIFVLKCGTINGRMNLFFFFLQHRSFVFVQWDVEVATLGLFNSKWGLSEIFSNNAFSLGLKAKTFLRWNLFVTITLIRIEVKSGWPLYVHFWTVIRNLYGKVALKGASSPGGRSHWTWVEAVLLLFSLSSADHQLAYLQSLTLWLLFNCPIIHMDQCSKQYVFLLFAFIFWSRVQ